MNIARTMIFVAGDGSEYGLVTLRDSAEVVVFVKRDGTWHGHVEFNRLESTGLPPQEATPEVAAALDRKPRKALDLYPSDHLTDEDKAIGADGK